MVLIGNHVTNCISILIMCIYDVEGHSAVHSSYAAFIMLAATYSGTCGVSGIAWCFVVACLK